MVTDAEALAKLGAKDWRSLNKNQIMSFLFETAPNLSDEVRLKILETAPDILHTAHSVLSEYQETAKNVLEQNQEIANKIADQNYDMARAIFISYHEATETLRGLLADSSASFEEKQYWSNELFKYLHEMREYDKDNKDFIGAFDKEQKSFLQNVLKCAGVAALILVGGSIALLTGGKSNISGSE